jgi:hypothetical protein
MLAALEYWLRYRHLALPSLFASVPILNYRQITHATPALSWRLTPLVLDRHLAQARSDPFICTATITGNPQNMIIGSLSHIPYGTFVVALWPVATVGIVLTTLLIALVYHREFLTSYDESGASQPISGHQVAPRDGRDDGLLLRRPTGRQGALLLFTRKVKADMTRSIARSTGRSFRAKRRVR